MFDLVMVVNDRKVDMFSRRNLADKSHQLNQHLVAYPVSSSIFNRYYGPAPKTMGSRCFAVRSDPWSPSKVPKAIAFSFQSFDLPLPALEFRAIAYPCANIRTAMHFCRHRMRRSSVPLTRAFIDLRDSGPSIRLRLPRSTLKNNLRPVQELHVAKHLEALSECSSSQTDSLSNPTTSSIYPLGHRSTMLS